MAGRGPAPAEQKRRRNVDPNPRTTITADGRLRGPQLPKDALGKDDKGKATKWHPRTVAFWTTWRKSAQAQTFTSTDWDFLLDTALMHHEMWTKGRWEFASEIRLRVAKYGATPEDRQRLRMTIETPTAARASRARAAAGNVTDIRSRRARLTSE